MEASHSSEVYWRFASPPCAERAGESQSQAYHTHTLSLSLTQQLAHVPVRDGGGEQSDGEEQEDKKEEDSDGDDNDNGGKQSAWSFSKQENPK